MTHHHDIANRPRSALSALRDDPTDPEGRETIHRDVPALIEMVEGRPSPGDADMVAVIARRLAKRDHGERYEGYESSHHEAAEDIAAALSVIPPAAGDDLSRVIAAVEAAGWNPHVGKFNSDPGAPTGWESTITRIDRQPIVTEIHPTPLAALTAAAQAAGIEIPAPHDGQTITLRLTPEMIGRLRSQQEDLQSNGGLLARFASIPADRVSGQEDANLASAILAQIDAQTRKQP